MGSNPNDYQSVKWEVTGLLRQSPFRRSSWVPQYFKLWWWPKLITLAWTFDNMNSEQKSISETLSVSVIRE